MKGNRSSRLAPELLKKAHERSKNERLQGF